MATLGELSPTAMGTRAEASRSAMATWGDLAPLAMAARVEVGRPAMATSPWI
jgi:hypothetical protein